MHGYAGGVAFCTVYRAVDVIILRQLRLVIRLRQRQSFLCVLYGLRPYNPYLETSQKRLRFTYILYSRITDYIYSILYIYMCVETHS